MREAGRLLCLALGVILGGLLAGLFAGKEKPALAANDHSEDYILCTGAVSADFKPLLRYHADSKSLHGPVEAIPVEGVWLLDYRSGKLLGTVVDRSAGKIVGWAEVDLIPEFGIAPQQNVHFTMTTGDVAPGQAALYIAETTTGKMGVYTMNPRGDGAPGVEIRRHDQVPFRSLPK